MINPLKTLDFSIEAPNKSWPEYRVGSNFTVDCLNKMCKSLVWSSIKKPESTEVKIVLSIQEQPERFLADPVRSLLDRSTETRKSFRDMRWRFRSSTEKRDLSEIVNQVILDYGLDSYKETIRYAVDEFFTNAIYNAPFYDRSLTLNRSTLVVLDHDKMAEMMIGVCDDRVMIGCVDKFGSLDCGQLLSHLTLLSQNGISSAVNMGVGGAGIGLFRLLQMIDEFYVIVEKDVRTFVGCTFTRTLRSKREPYLGLTLLDSEILDLGSLKVRIQAREDRAIWTFCGSPDDKVRYSLLPVKQVNIVHIDLQFLKEGTGLDILINWLRTFLDTKAVQFLNVPSFLMGRLEYKSSSRLS